MPQGLPVSPRARSPVRAAPGRSAWGAGPGPGDSVPLWEPLTRAAAANALTSCAAAPAGNTEPLKAGVVKLFTRGLSLLRVINSLTATLRCNEWTHTLGRNSYANAEEPQTKSPRARWSWWDSVQTPRAIHMPENQHSSQPNTSHRHGRWHLHIPYLHPAGATHTSCTPGTVFGPFPKPGTLAGATRMWSPWEPAQPPALLEEHCCGTLHSTAAPTSFSCREGGIPLTWALHIWLGFGKSPSIPNSPWSQSVSFFLALPVPNLVFCLQDFKSQLKWKKTKQRHSRKSFEEKE